MRIFGRFNLKTLFLLTTLVACLCSCYRVYSTCISVDRYYIWKLSKKDTLHISHNLNSAYVQCRDTVTHQHADYSVYNKKIYKCSDKWTMHNQYFFFTTIYLPSFKTESSCQHSLICKSKGYFEPGEYYEPYTIVENHEPLSKP